MCLAAHGEIIPETIPAPIAAMMYIMGHEEPYVAEDHAAHEALEGRVEDADQTLDENGRECLQDVDLISGKQTPGWVTTQEKVFSTWKSFYAGWNEGIGISTNLCEESSFSLICFLAELESDGDAVCIGGSGSVIDGTRAFVF